MLLHAWRQLSTPDLASVLGVRRGVLVRGGTSDSPRHGMSTAVTCQHGAVNTRSPLPCDDIVTSTRSQSDEDTSTCHRRPVISSSGGVLSRGFMAARMDQTLGLASVLDPSPTCPPTSSGDAKPNIYHRSTTSRFDPQSNDTVQGRPKVIPMATLAHGTSRFDLEPNDTLSSSLPSDDHSQKFCPCYCRTIVSECLSADQDSRPSPICTKAFDGIARPNDLYTVCDLHSHLRPSDDLQTKGDLNVHCRDKYQLNTLRCGGNGRSSDLQRPSDDLQAEGDLEGTSLSSSFHRQQTSRLCCSQCRPHHAAAVVATSTPACTMLGVNSTTMCQTQGSSLYEELLPYLSDSNEDHDDDDDCDQMSSCSVTTDDEY